MFKTQCSPFIRPYIFKQLNRYGVMTLPQLQRMCAHLTGKSNFYRIFQNLKRDGVIHRMAHPTKPLFAYRLAPDYQGDPDLLDEDAKPFRYRDVDLEHALMCTEVLTRLTYFENITGIATEYELTPADAKNFCPHRRPDGIGQLTNERSKFEFAVEVETSRKSLARIQEIIRGYVEMIDSGAYDGRAVLLVAPRLGVYTAYEKELGSVPEKMRHCFRLVVKPDLSELKTEIFGQVRTTPDSSAERMRKSNSGEIEYLPMFSTHPLPHRAPYRPIPMDPVTDTESQVCHSVDFE